MFKKLGSKLKDQKGFTLIELLAVIVILGIIAAIAIPAIGNVIKKSEDKAMVQDALLILDAAKLYVAENNPKETTFYLTLDGGTTTQDGKALDTAAPLNGYLDRVKDKEFEVIISYSAGTFGSKYSYSIANHEAVPVADTTLSKATGVSVTEKKLSEYK